MLDVGSVCGLCPRGLRAKAPWGHCEQVNLRTVFTGRDLSPKSKHTHEE